MHNDLMGLIGPRWKGMGTTVEKWEERGRERERERCDFVGNDMHDGG